MAIPITATNISSLARAIKSGLEVFQRAGDARRLQGPLQNAPMIEVPEQARLRHQPSANLTIDGFSHPHSLHRQERQSRAGWPVLHRCGPLRSPSLPGEPQPIRLRNTDIGVGVVDLF